MFKQDLKRQRRLHRIKKALIHSKRLRHPKYELIPTKPTLWERLIKFWKKT
jgi:hypothetical protein